MGCRAPAGRRDSPKRSNTSSLRGRGASCGHIPHKRPTPHPRAATAVGTHPCIAAVLTRSRHRRPLDAVVAGGCVLLGPHSGPKCTNPPATRPTPLIAPVHAAGATAPPTKAPRRPTRPLIAAIHAAGATPRPTRTPRGPAAPDAPTTQPPRPAPPVAAAPALFAPRRPRAAAPPTAPAESRRQTRTSTRSAPPRGHPRSAA